jgi:protein tyrosine/serine phosphatase
VVPGRVYRSNHLPPFRLRQIVARFGLRTVVNLRGSAPNPSTTLSEAEAKRLGVDHVFMAFESRGAPHRDRILRFHDIYRAMHFPALLHCKSGADRAGLASGLVLLFEGGTAAAAARQLSLRYLHIARSPTGILDAFFRMYAAEGEGRKPFLDWVREDYREEELRRRFRAGGLMTFLNDRLLARE